jgi:hypothetical protein
MMRRRFGLIPLLLALGACSVSDSTAPRGASAQAGYDWTGGDTHDGHLVPGSVGNAGLAPATGQQTALACAVPAPLYGQAAIGPNGGELDVGPHRLIVPPGALTETVVLSGTVPAGNSILIDFAPHGLQFKKPAGLILDASSCGNVPNVLYLDEQGNIAERITATFSNWWHTIAAPLDHFSTYMIDI